MQDLAAAAAAAVAAASVQAFFLSHLCEVSMGLKGQGSLCPCRFERRVEDLELTVLSEALSSCSAGYHGRP